MYTTKERKDTMSKQIASHHQSSEEAASYSAEVVEWQQKAKSHKSSSNLVQSAAHFQTVS